MKYLLVFIEMFFLSVFGTFGQEIEKDPDSNYIQLEKKYKNLKDSLSKSYFFIPAVSSVMLQNKQIEAIFFSSIFSANKFWDVDGNIEELNVRSTYFFNTLQFTYGISKNARWNIGLDINSKVARIDANRNSTIFRIFNSDIYGNSKYARAISSFGPRLRMNPFRKNNYFVLQNSLIFPIKVKEEKELIFGQNQISFVTQLLYNQPLSNNFFLFTQLGTQYGFKNNDVTSKFYPSLTGYINYLIPKRMVIFAFLNYLPVFSNDDNWKYVANTLQAGGGLQYQFSGKILINVFYSNIIAGSNSLDFSSYTICLRFITN